MKHPSGHGLMHGYDEGDTVMTPSHEHGFGPKMQALHEAAVKKASNKRLGKHFARLTAAEKGIGRRKAHDATNAASQRAFDEMSKRGFGAASHSRGYGTASRGAGKVIAGAFRKELKRVYP